MAISPKDVFTGKIDISDLINYPLGKARDVAVAGDGTGTPFVAALVNDIFGLQQWLLSKAGITASGTNDGAVTSQYGDAIRKISGYPGKMDIVTWPTIPTGLRAFFLDGSMGATVSVATYPDLVAASYVGDGNNAAAHAADGKFCKTSDAAGLTPSTSGAYLTIPDMRFRAPRGLGGGRYMGHYEADQVQSHNHLIVDVTAAAGVQDAYIGATLSGTAGTIDGLGHPPAGPTQARGDAVADNDEMGEAIGTHGVARQDSTGSTITGHGRVGTETRMMNVGIKYILWY